LKELEKRIFEAKKKGLTDQEISEKYKVNLRFIEKVMTKRLGVNVSSPTMKKKIKTLQPPKFALETTTVWSFKSRGNWATHSGNYRGNWSPYIPRNVILRYSKEKELVLDCFCGAGTTGVECKLTNRNFIGIDINPKAIELAKENINFPIYGSLYKDSSLPKINFYIGDARDLSFIKDETIDLICTHPPYADIIHYTNNQEQDLSFCDVNEFLEEMNRVAKENYRVLKNGKYCAVLIGDMRKKKHVIPLGFWLIDVYLKNGFALKELVIKRQHNCKTTGFWYKNSIKYNFLLLAHEYLAIFKKVPIEKKYIPEIKSSELSFQPVDIEKLESTTVWIFDHNNWYNMTIQNLIERYNGNDYYIMNKLKDFDRLNKLHNMPSLVIINSINQGITESLYNNINEILSVIQDNGHLAVICNDKRLKNGTIYPTGLKIEEKLRGKKELNIKELVVISIENKDTKMDSSENLEITHKYLLIYRVNKGD